MVWTTQVGAYPFRIIQLSKARYVLCIGQRKQFTWPESSGLGNFVDFWLATLPMALPPKFFAFLTELGNFRQRFFRGNAIANVANQKLTALPRADDSGHCLIGFSGPVYTKFYSGRIKEYTYIIDFNHLLMQVANNILFYLAK